MPPLDVRAPTYNGAWAASTTGVFVDLMMVGPLAL